MLFKSLTYTSLARPNLSQNDFAAIRDEARCRNAADGITGLLIFNGTHFLQTIEGSERAISALVDRLRADLRHSGFEVRDERHVDDRSFPGWSMEFVTVPAGFFEAREAIAGSLPDTVPMAIQARLLRMTELISTMQFPG